MSEEEFVPCVCCATAPQQDNGFCTFCNMFGCVEELKNYIIEDVTVEEKEEETND